MGRKVKDGSTGLRHEPESHTWDIIRSLVSSETDASKLLEMYYWTREPGIVELIRAYLNLPDRAQRHLSDFLLKNRPQSIASVIDQQDRLVLAAAGEQTKNQRSSGAGSV
jgi:hypothetical protein